MSDDVSDIKCAPNTTAASRLAGSPIDVVALQTAVDALREEIQLARAEAHHARFLFLDLQRRVHAFLFEGTEHGACSGAQEGQPSQPEAHEKACVTRGDSAAPEPSSYRNSSTGGVDSSSSSADVAHHAATLITSTTSLQGKFHLFGRELLSHVHEHVELRCKAAESAVSTRIAGEVQGLHDDLRATLSSYRSKIVALETRIETEAALASRVASATHRQLRRVSSNILLRGSASIMRAQAFAAWHRFTLAKRRTRVRLRAAEALQQTASTGATRVTFRAWRIFLQQRKAKRHVEHLQRIVPRLSNPLLCGAYWRKWLAFAARQRRAVAVRCIAACTAGGLRRSYFDRWRHAMVSCGRAGAPEQQHRCRQQRLQAARAREGVRQESTTVLWMTASARRTHLLSAWHRWLRESRLRKVTRISRRRSTLCTIGIALIELHRHGLDSPVLEAKLRWRFFNRWRGFVASRLGGTLRWLQPEVKQLSARANDADRELARVSCVEAEVKQLSARANDADRELARVSCVEAEVLLAQEAQIGLRADIAECRRNAAATAADVQELRGQRVCERLEEQSLRCIRQAALLQSQVEELRAAWDDERRLREGEQAAVAAAIAQIAAGQRAPSGVDGRSEGATDGTTPTTTTTEEGDDQYESFWSSGDRGSVTRHSTLGRRGARTHLRGRDRLRRINALLALQHQLGDHDVLLCLRDWVDDVECRQVGVETAVRGVVAWIEALQKELISLRIIRAPFK